VQNIMPREPRILFLTILKSIKDKYEHKKTFDKLPNFEMLEKDNIPKDLEFFTFDQDMNRLNEFLTNKNLQRLVLIFDEVEVLLRFGGMDTLERLYSLTQDYGSPFYNIFKTVELHPLTSEDARSLLEVPASRIGMSIAPNESKKILRYAGNNPYFIQGIAHYLVEELNVQKRHCVYPEDVDKVVKQSCDTLSAQLAYMWGGISQIQKIILYSLAKVGHPLTAEVLMSYLPRSEPFILSKQAQQEVFDDLVQQQILKTENANQYWFVVLLFVDWILLKMDEEEVIKSVIISETSRSRNYNIRAIRELLTQVYSREDIEILAHDYYKDVYDQFSTSQTDGIRIRLLLDYVFRYGQIDKLLSIVRDTHPKQYAAFEKSLFE
jgi:hypothetical protein